ncbi:hypothetical protein CFBP498_14010 [Xanthomonas hortorum pv. vitians]|uniref:Uncharacterized protein n=1 Tax=Xanthomonas hortorum pv. vitians TaxID=83224 RepID=A0A6V7CIY2_9XANT|nr:hypothetical protein CFBP498_14010 [Xanthomonas hortorum pv. vitians]CAD0317428.1 hypothetical protein CFBP498_14010 [Xanthomonas hortorum pv. vitians]
MAWESNGLAVRSTASPNDDAPRKAGRRWQRRVCAAYFFFGMYRSVMVPS